MEFDALKTIPTSTSLQGMTEDWPTWRDKELCDWTGTSLGTTGPVTPTNGATAVMNSNPSSMFISSSHPNAEGGYFGGPTDGFEVKKSGSGAGECNFIIESDPAVGQRWMPASVFNGFFFKITQSSGAAGAPYYRRIALKFVNNYGSHRIWCWNRPYYFNGPKNGRDSHVIAGGSAISTIRGWGNGWTLHSVIFNCKAESGSSSGTIRLEQLGIAHEYSTDNSGWRVLPQGRRPYSERNSLDTRFRSALIT